MFSLKFQINELQEWSLKYAYSQNKWEGLITDEFQKIKINLNEDK